MSVKCSNFLHHKGQIHLEKRKRSRKRQRQTEGAASFRDKDRPKELLVFYDGTKTMVVSSKKTRTKQTVNNDAKRTAHWLLVCIFKEVVQALDNQ